MTGLLARPIGLVLAGGLGRRLGQGKAELMFEGQPLALRAAKTLSPLCESVLISVRPGARNPASGFAAIEDRAPAGRGPLAGIDAAFAATSSADLLVLACDYPRATTQLLGGLLALAALEDELVFPRDDRGGDHPLIGLWRRRLHDLVREALQRGHYRLQELFPRVRVRRVGREQWPAVDGRLLLNLNRPEDLEQL